MPGFEYEYFEPGAKRISVYGIIATIGSQRVGSSGCQGLSPPHGNVGDRKPALCDRRWRSVISETSPYGSWTARSSGTYFTIGSESASFPRSRSCMSRTAVNVFVMDAQCQIVASRRGDVLLAVGEAVIRGEKNLAPSHDHEARPDGARLLSSRT